MDEIYDALVLDVEGRQVCTTTVLRHEVNIGVRIIGIDPQWMRRIPVRSEGAPPDEESMHFTLVARYERTRGDGTLIFRLPLHFRPQPLAL